MPELALPELNISYYHTDWSRRILEGKHSIGAVEPYTGSFSSISIHSCIYIFMYISIHPCIYIYMYISIHPCIYVSMSISLQPHIYMIILYISTFPSISTHPYISMKTCQVNCPTSLTVAEVLGCLDRKTFSLEEAVNGKVHRASTHKFIY